jgi:hypothetical protein
MWVCPRCGRQFRNKNQWHSCIRFKVEDHFIGKPERLLLIFNFLLEKLRTFGPVRVDAVKTGINLGARAHFAGVQVRKGWLNVGFVLDRVVSDPKIMRVTEITETSFQHRVRVFDENDIDEQLI